MNSVDETEKRFYWIFHNPKYYVNGIRFGISPSGDGLFSSANCNQANICRKELG